MGNSPWGYKESDITEQLTLSLFLGRWFRGGGWSIPFTTAYIVNTLAMVILSCQYEISADSWEELYPVRS